MANKKAQDVKITDTKKTEVKKPPKQKLTEEATALGIKLQGEETVKELKALIVTEKVKFDLPAPPPPPPALSFMKLPNKDIIIKVRALGAKGPARLLQGKVYIDGIEKWENLCVISPAGAPRIVLKAKVREDTLKLTQDVKEVRLRDRSATGTIMETMKLK